MGNFLDNSLNLSSEFLRSFVTFQAQKKNQHYQESRTRPIPGFLGWFLLMRLDKFLPGKKKLLHRFPQTTCTITSNPPAHRRSPVSAQTHNRKLFLFSWQFHNYHFNFLHSRIIIPHEPVRLQTINPAALVLCSLKVCFQYSPAARVPNNWTDLPPRRNKWPDRRSWAPPHNYHTFTRRITLIYRRVSSQDHPSKIEYQTLDIALLK